MRKCVPMFIAVPLLMVAELYGQSNPAPMPNQVPAYRSGDPIENMSSDVSRITRAVESLSRSLGEFTKTFSTNQGLQLSERAQKLLLALEVLNRIEVSLANMQKLKLDLIERQSRFRLQLATVTDDLQPQSIDRYVALRGTTDAEALRDIRRTALEKERRELMTVLSQIERELAATEMDIRRTEAQVRTLRTQVFGEIERQLADI